MTQSIDDTDLAAVLDWYRAMGVDSATADIATDWTARGGAVPGTGFRMATVPVSDPPSMHVSDMTGQTPLAPSVAAKTTYGLREVSSSDSRATVSDPERQTPNRNPAGTTAGQAARGAQNLAELEAALKHFDGCALKATAKNLCFYRGAPKARVMLIGEAPGRDEDLEGKPFVGRAGQLLDKMLAAIGLGEADVHITNVVYWRPPGNRTPTPQETQVCQPFLERQIELVEPEVVLLLGGTAAKHVLGVAEGILRIRGQWKDVEFGRLRLRTLATLHPAYLLRSPSSKRQAWQDLLAVKHALKR